MVLNLLLWCAQDGRTVGVGSAVQLCFRGVGDSWWIWGAVEGKLDLWCWDEIEMWQRWDLGFGEFS
jgi:hypothetical protein